jgi:hypothetical protein
MLLANDIFGPETMATQGGGILNKIRENPGKARRVLNEIGRMQKEQIPFSKSAIAAFNFLWKTWK